MIRVKAINIFQCCSANKLEYHIKLSPKDSTGISIQRTSINHWLLLVVPSNVCLEHR